MSGDGLPEHLQGRFIGSKELELIRLLLVENPHWSRSQLSRAVRVVGVARSQRTAPGYGRARPLAQTGGARLLAPAGSSAGSRPSGCSRNCGPSTMPTAPIQVALTELGPLQIQEISQSPQERLLFAWLLHRYHYLSYASAVGLNLQYLIYDQQRRPLGCLLFGSAAGMPPARPLHRLDGQGAVKLTCKKSPTIRVFSFCLGSKCGGLASQVVRPSGTAAPSGLARKYGRPLSLIETFVHTSRFTRPVLWRGQLDRPGTDDRSHAPGPQQSGRGSTQSRFCLSADPPTHS